MYPINQKKKNNKNKNLSHQIKTRQHNRSKGIFLLPNLFTIEIFLVFLP